MGAALAGRLSLLTLLVALAPGPSQEGDPSPLSETQRREPSPAEVELVSRRLRAEVEALTAPPGRSWRQPEALSRAAARLADSWAAAGYRVERQQIPGMGPQYANVLAFPPGVSWGAGPLLLAAHYDAVEGTPGADDNASGVAVLLETSRALAARGGGRQPVVFAALTLEEPPFFGTDLQGGWVLARSLRLCRVSLAGAVVLEMVGYYRRPPGTQLYPFPLGLFGYPATGDFVGVVGNLGSRRLARALASAVRSAGLPSEILIVPGRGGLLPAVRLSDHAAFWDQGYRGVMLTDTSFFRNPNYHLSSDLPDTLDYASMARLALGLASLLERAQ